tara:strand:- start:3546 stop:3974 length:429 start_codon:yes stop_codon:yes gene_type:complete
MNRKSMALSAAAASMLMLPSASFAQPHPENFAGCQGGCDGASRNLSAETESLHRATRSYNRGLAKLKKQDFAKAAKLFGNAAESVPGKAEFNYMAGSSYYFAGEHDLARTYLTEALAIEGEDAIDAGQREIAEDILRKVSAN